MKKTLITILLFLGLFIGGNVFAGGCYEDPIINTNYMAKITTGANVRNRPCMEGTNVVTTASVGTKIQIIAYTDGWVQAKLPDGTIGRIGTWLTSKIDDAPPSVPVNTDSLYTSNESSTPTSYMPTTSDKSLLEKIYAKIDKIAEENVEKLEKIQDSIGEIKNKYKSTSRIYYILDKIENYINEKLDMIDIMDIFDI